LQPKGSAVVHGHIRYDGTLPDTVHVILFPEYNPAPDDPPELRRFARSARGTFAVNGEFAFEGVEPGGHVAISSFQVADGRDAGGSSGLFQVSDRGSVDIVIELNQR
jgi:hypothetical protein